MRRMGPLPVLLKSQIERDLAILIGEEWLSEPVQATASADRIDRQQSALLAAIEERAAARP